MARGKRAKAADKATASSALVNALKFVSVAQKEIGQPYQTHVALLNNTAVAFDGTVAAGCQIEEDLVACPHTLRLIDALAKCGDTLSITQLDGDRLSIKSDKFKAYVPCVPVDNLTVAYPDPPCAVIDDRIKKGFEVVGVLASDNSQHVVTASILLRAGSMVATDRNIMFEYWHGIDLPPGIVVPKAGAIAVTKINKPLAQLGFSSRSVTFYFEDGSWLRSQLYDDKWPDIDRVLNVKNNPWPIPEGFFKAVEAVASFSQSGALYFKPNLLRSHAEDGIGASYEVTGLPGGPIYRAKHLKLIEPYAKTIDFIGQNGIAYFYGDDIRGAITSMRS
jgi:hypothetical protein